MLNKNSSFIAKFKTKTLKNTMGFHIWQYVVWNLSEPLLTLSRHGNRRTNKIKLIYRFRSIAPSGLNLTDRTDVK